MLRLVLVAVAVLGTTASMSEMSVQATSGARWYRGSTHAHTLNSDGDSPPADVVRWYREHGYDFVVISDHEHLTDVAPLNAAHGRPGVFLVIQGQEVTQRVADSTHPEGWRQAHVNGVGVTRVVMPLGQRAVAQGTTIAATYARNLAEITAAGGLPQVNHPNWRWSVRPEDMTALPDSTLFEVWNAHPGVNNFGGDDGTGRIALSTEALWDTLLTRGTLLFGVASDDAHHFLPRRLEDPESTGPGGGWVMLRADTLAPAAIIAALRAGNFYSSTGVVLEDYAVTAREVRLRIRPSSASDDRRYRTQFIGRGGRILAEVTGTSPTYVLRGNEGYVRATVWDSNGRRAWTQPHWVGPR